MLDDRIWDHLRRSGPLRGPELQARLGVSQSTLSRALRASEHPILVSGRARNTTYAARRAIRGVHTPIPVYEVGVPPVSPRVLCHLHPIEPADGIWVEPLAEGGPGGFFDDLPWFLQDLRPSGFLGRLVPRRHPELELPPDVRVWRADDVLRYLSQAGWDPPGALILGEPAYQRFLEQAARPDEPVAAADRAQVWPRLAEELLRAGRPGSSAAGEQPKFLATALGPAGATPVLVKFSPPTDTEVAQRIADVLVCECIALGVIAQTGIVPAASARIVEAGGRVFLEVDRFDRVGQMGRRGVFSLEALDAEHVGSDRSSWSGATRVLVEDGWLGGEDHRRVRWLEQFGRWIGNTDMHFGNLGFLARGTRLLELAPAYDMAPMAWFPRGHELVPVPFEPAPPEASDADIALGAWSAARRFWSEVEHSTAVSEAFRCIGGSCGRALDALRPVLDLLPEG